MNSRKNQYSFKKVLKFLNNININDKSFQKLLSLIAECSNTEFVSMALNVNEEFKFFSMPQSKIDQPIFSNCFYNATDNNYNECLCRQVVNGVFDNSKSNFTEDGSFWSNNYSQLKSSNSNTKKSNIVNCIKGLGFESISIIPLLNEENTIGLLYFYDYNSNLFSQELIQFFESIAMSIGMALGNAIAKQNLENSEEKYRSLTENMFDIVYSANKEGIITYISPQTKRYGLEPEEFISKQFLEFVHPDDREKLGSEFDKSIDSLEEFPSIFRILDSVGSEHWFEDRGKIQKDENGIIVGIAGVLRDVTIRKQVEEALRKSESMYRFLFENAAIGIGISDLDGIILDANETMCEITGYSREEMNKLNLKNTYVNIEDRDNLINKINENGLVENYEIQFKNKSGNSYWSSLSTRLIEYRNQKAFLTALVDISERKKVEEALIASNVKLETLFNSLEDFLWVLDYSGKIIAVNQIVSKRLGYSESELIGNNLLMVHPAELKNEVKRIVSDMINGNIAVCPIPLVTKNGKQIPVETKITLGRWDNQDVIFGISRDISERLKNEEQLRKLSMAVEQSPSSIVITDIEGDIEYVNPKFSEITGYNENEVIGQNPRLLNSGEKSKDIFEEMWKNIISGETWRGEFHNKKKNGELYWEDAFVGPIKNENGEITNFIAIKEDITKQKLLQDQVRQAQKMEAVGTLAGGIAHDFNNILAALIGYIELLKLDLPENGRPREYLDQIFGASLRARDLVNQISTFSRKTNVEYREVQISHIIKEVLKLLRASLPRSIEIKTDIKDKYGIAISDPTQIHQLLMNLCTNSYYAMRETGGTLNVSLDKIELKKAKQINGFKLKPGAYIKLCVSDTGGGIEPAILKKIFDPFYTTKPVGEGTGMGLSVVHGIVKSHGGEISVNSVLNTKTKFTIYLPRVENVSGEKKHKYLKPLNGNGKILFVDDEESIIKSSKLLLQSLGYEVTGETDPEKALELFKIQSENFDLVISDLTMPHFTGDKLAAEILKINSTIPIILATGYRDTNTEKRARQLGVKAFLNKPILTYELTKIIKDVLNNNGKH